MREIYRTLVPGGICLFTTPTYPDRQRSEQVAFLEPDGSTRIVGQAEYHGNPQHPEQGSLVTWRYGYDLPLLLQRETGFDVEVRRWQSKAIAVMGPMTEVYICRKPTMNFSGERYLPEIGGVIRAEHLHRYRLACALAPGKDVLDVACGEGYGSAMLARVAQSVTGVDVSAEAVEHAAARYRRPQLRFLHGDCAALPCADAAFDLVVSFETIEHHDRHEAMMREIRRVLRPGGVLMISSPNRPEYDRTLTEPNPFHVKELDFEEFSSLLRAHFPNVAFYGQRVLGGSLIAPMAEAASGFRYFGDEAEAASIPKPVYFVALASDGPLPSLGVSIHALDALTAPLSSGAVTEVRLYIAEREAEGGVSPYGEGRGAAAQYALSGARTNLTLTLPPDVRPLVSLRLDPASAPAAIVLHRLSLHDAGGAELWRWRGDDASFTHMIGAALRPTAAGPCLVCFNDDPQFELALPEAVLRQLGPGAGLVVEMTPRPLLEALPELLAQVKEAVLPAAARTQLPATAAGHLAELGELLKTVVERKNATIESQRAEIQALQDRQNALYEQLVRAEAQLDLLKQLVLPEAGSRLERL